VRLEHSVVEAACELPFDDVAQYLSLVFEFGFDGDAG
jgi:hypothetical protein